MFNRKREDELKQNHGREEISTIVTAEYDEMDRIWGARVLGEVLTICLVYSLDVF